MALSEKQELWNELTNHPLFQESPKKDELWQKLESLLESSRATMTTQQLKSLKFMIEYAYNYGKSKKP